MKMNPLAHRLAYRTWHWILILAVCLLPSCSKPTDAENPEVEVLEKRLEKMQTELKQIESSIQNSESDPALKAKLQEDRKLSESRKERVINRLKKHKPDAASEAAGHGAPASGGH
jgi:cob(I)alamin adenosyltransferase